MAEEKPGAQPLIYRFENFALDIGRRELRCGGAVRPVEPQVFKLLCFLIENRDRVVSRDDIFQAVWQGRVVCDSVLDTRMNAARRAIGDNGRQQRLIRTCRGHGFRFVGAVNEDHVAVEPIAPAFPGQYRHAQEWSAIWDRKPSLVALQVDNIPADDELAWITRGIMEDVAVALASGRSFHVITHGRACRDGDDLRCIANEVGAGYLLICGSRRVNDRVRLTARLVEASKGIHIWAQSWTGESHFEFASVNAISSRVAASIEAHICAAEENRTRRKPFDALSAAECVATALAVTKVRSRQNYASAEKLLQRAMELDPSYARAHGIAAFFAGCEVLYGWKSREGTLPLALDSAYKAVALDESDPWAHFALGWALTQNRLPNGGIEEYQRAITINPCFPSARACLGLALSYVGRTEEALIELENGERLGAPEIFNGLSNSARAGVYFCAEDHRTAISAARRSVRQSPGLVASQRQLVVNCVLAGEMDEARAAYSDLVRLVPNLSLRSIANALPYIRDRDLNRALEGLRRIGVR